MIKKIKNKNSIKITKKQILKAVELANQDQKKLMETEEITIPKNWIDAMISQTGYFKDYMRKHPERIELEVFEKLTRLMGYIDSLRYVCRKKKQKSTQQNNRKRKR